MNSDPIAAIEIGTTHTSIAVGEPLPNGRIRIHAISSIPSSGVRKSQIIETEQARYSINSVMRDLSDKKDVSVAQAYLAVSGPQIRTKVIESNYAIKSGTVTDEDVTQLSYKVFDDIVLPEGRIEIEVSPLGYKLDNMEQISSPRGLKGRMLTQYGLCIHGDANRIEDARNTASAAKLELLPDVYFAGSCAAAAVLTPQQKRDGALVIDLGGGSTSFVVWSGEHLVHAGVLGVGGDHIKNDIHCALSISLAQAETLKLEHASAIISPEDANQRIEITGHLITGTQAPSVSRCALNTVVNARVKEIFDYIQEQLDEAGLIHSLNGGIFLTGGGAALTGINELASKVFGCPVQTGRLVPEIEGLADDQHPESKAVLAGLILLVHQQNAPKPSLFESIVQAFTGIFHK